MNFQQSDVRPHSTIDVNTLASEQATLTHQVASRGLPPGWTESRPGGLATNPDPNIGGIIDRTFVHNDWFIVFHRDELEVLEGFASRELAFEAFHRVIGQAAQPTALGNTRQFVALDGQRFVTNVHGADMPLEVGFLADVVNFTGPASYSLELAQVQSLHAILGRVIGRAEFDGRTARGVTALGGPGPGVDEAPAIGENSLPFLMIAKGGHVGIYDRDDARLLPTNWTGLCTDVDDTLSFWHIGFEEEERSFTKLMARTHEAAVDECKRRNLRPEALTHDAHTAVGNAQGEVRS